MTHAPEDEVSEKSANGRDQASSGSHQTRAQSLLLVAVLLAAFVLRLWDLTSNGWGAEYYTAAVRSMSLNWHNFFYAAFDPLGFISVDKPPVALWLQVISVKLLGFEPLSVLLPQVLEGVGAVALLYHLVKRSFGATAALWAALFLSLTPISVAVNRTNNVDSCLVLALLFVAWPFLKAVESGSRRLLLVSLLVAGIAFNIKMLAAYLVLPPVFIVYALLAPLPMKRRVTDLALGLIVLVAVSLPWIVAVQLSPGAERPYVGSTRTNSMFELVVGHNAQDRFLLPSSQKSGGALQDAREIATQSTSDPDDFSDIRASARRIAIRLFVLTPTGPLRLLGGQLSAQVEWLLPLALAGLVLGAAGPPGSTGRPEASRDPRRAAIWFWLIWIATDWAVYSALGGIIHFYYLATLAPALAAMAGVGLAVLWQAYRRRMPWQTLLPLTLGITAVWQLHIEASAMGWGFAELWHPPERWPAALHVGLLATTALGCATLLGSSGTKRSTGVRAWLELGALAIGVSGLMLLPLVWALSCVLLPAQGTVPSADLYRLSVVSRSPLSFFALRFGKTADTTALVGFLKANQGTGKYLLATSTTQVAAPIIIESGEPVLARGGFHGMDGALEPEQLARMVQQGDLRFAMLDDVAQVSRRLGADVAGEPVTTWIRAHGKLVDAALWGGLRIPGLRPEIYDLRPDLGVVATP